MQQRNSSSCCPPVASENSRRDCTMYLKMYSWACSTRRHGDLSERNDTDTRGQTGSWDSAVLHIPDLNTRDPGVLHSMCMWEKGPFSLQPDEGRRLDHLTFLWVAARGEGAEGPGGTGKRVRSVSWQLQNSHRKVKDSRGRTVINAVITT